MTRRIALVGPGRAGGAVALALTRAGHRVVAIAGRAADSPSVVGAAARFGARAVDVADAGVDADLVLLAPPDDALEHAVEAVIPGLGSGTLVIHLSGARGLGVLHPILEHGGGVAIGALHPLQSLPSAEVGAERLAGSWAAVAGGPEVVALALELGLEPFEIDDEHRAEYHAAACIASNHLVALLGQVDRVAASAGVPRAAFDPLIRSTIDNVASMGARSALTGPVARGDVRTVSAHLSAIPVRERRAYRALADSARELAAVDDPELLALLTDRGSQC